MGYAERRYAIERKRVELGIGWCARRHGTHRVRVHVDRADAVDVREKCRVDGRLCGGGAGSDHEGDQCASELDDHVLSVSVVPTIRHPKESGKESAVSSGSER